MTELEIPQFSNSCGKLFADKIILASSNKESLIDLNTVRNVSFTSRPAPKSLFFIALPLPLFFMPSLLNENDFFVKVMFVTVGLLLLLVSVWQVNKNYTLSLKLKDGSSTSINVWEGNRKEAQKFADRVKSQIVRLKA
ncbi:MAG: hypothetical protein V4581_17895 [Bacteroidota bacterium]